MKGEKTYTESHRLVDSEPDPTRRCLYIRVQRLMMPGLKHREQIWRCPSPKLLMAHRTTASREPHALMTCTLKLSSWIQSQALNKKYEDVTDFTYMFCVCARACTKARDDKLGLNMSKRPSVISLTKNHNGQGKTFSHCWVGDAYQVASKSLAWLALGEEFSTVHTLPCSKPSKTPFQPFVDYPLKIWRQDAHMPA